MSRSKNIKSFLENECIQSQYPFDNKPLKLLQWQHLLIDKLYQDDSPYKICSVWVGRGSGKTTLMAGLCIYHLLERPGSQIYIISGTVEMAKLCFNQINAFIQNNSALSELLWVRDNLNRIETKGKHKSFLKVQSGSDLGKAGANANVVLIDEVAALGPHARDIWQQIALGGIKRGADRLIITLSTSQFDQSTLGYELWQKARDVAKDQTLDPTFLPIVYGLEPGADWTNEESWWSAHPGIQDDQGRNGIIPRQTIKEEFARCKNNTAQEIIFKTHILGLWVGTIRQWMPSDIWNACAQNFTEESLYGLPCYVGADFAYKWDLGAYVLLVEKDDKLYILPRAFTPADLVNQHTKTDGVNYLHWSLNPKNNLTLCPGDTIDSQIFIDSIAADAKKFKIVSLGFDESRMELIRQKLEYDHYLPCTAVPQSFGALSPATNLFEKLVREKRLIHNDNQLLNYCLNNCSVKLWKDSIMIEKAKSSKRIDLIAATVIALNRYLDKTQHSGRYDYFITS